MYQNKYQQSNGGAQRADGRAVPAALSVGPTAHSGGIDKLARAGALAALTLGLLRCPARLWGVGGRLEFGLGYVAHVKEDLRQTRQPRTFTFVIIRLPGCLQLVEASACGSAVCTVA